MTRDDLLKDLILDLSRRVDDIREDLAQIKQELSGDMSEVKSQQQECKRNWNFVSKVLSFGVAPVSAASVLAWLSEKLHIIPKQ